MRGLFHGIFYQLNWFLFFRRKDPVYKWLVRLGWGKWRFVIMGAVFCGALALSWLSRPLSGLVADLEFPLNVTLYPLIEFIRGTWWALVICMASLIFILLMRRRLAQGHYGEQLYESELTSHDVYRVIVSQALLMTFVIFFLSRLLSLISMPIMSRLGGFPLPSSNPIELLYSLFFSYHYMATEQSDATLPAQLGLVLVDISRLATDFLRGGFSFVLGVMLLAGFRGKRSLVLRVISCLLVYHLTMTLLLRGALLVRTPFMTQFSRALFPGPNQAITLVDAWPFFLLMYLHDLVVILFLTGVLTWLCRVGMRYFALESLMYTSVFEDLDEDERAEIASERWVDTIKREVYLFFHPLEREYDVGEEEDR